MADDLAWETTASRVDYSCPGFDVRRDEVILPDGTDTDYHYVDEPAAVVVLPFTPDGEVVVIDEWRQAVERTNRGLPAGSVEPDDTELAAAARRELREETGYRAETVSHLCTVEPANGIADSVHHHFVARGCVPDGDQTLDFNESISVTTVEYDALLAAVLDGGRPRDGPGEGRSSAEGPLRDGRAVLAVTQYELRDSVGAAP